MKTQKFATTFLTIIYGIGIIFVIIIIINLYIYTEQSKPKFTNDISDSDSILLQNEFAISLPEQAKITALGYCTDLIVIRIEGVDDLPTFLRDTIHLELDTKESEKLADEIFETMNDNNQEYEDMYGSNRQSSFFLNSNYQTNPIDAGTITSFFLLDGKLVIEIKKPETTTGNREAIKEIVGT